VQCSAHVRLARSRNSPRWLILTPRVATHLENLEKSGNSKVVREKLEKMEKVREKSGKLKFAFWTLNKLKS